jgi:hypothetical protein
VVVADGAITNAANSAFGSDVKRVYCWAHVIRNADNNLHRIKDIKMRASVRADIVQLQLASTEDEFQTASKLWITKWASDPVTLDFANYFRTEHIDKCSGWFESRAPGSPSTNNGLEATNNVIKKECTIRERLPMGLFFEKSKEYVEGWSESRNPATVNFTTFAVKPSITLRLETSAYNWARSNSFIRSSRDKGCYYIRTKESQKSFPISEVNEYERQRRQMQWRKFSTYAKWKSSFSKVTMAGGEWEGAFCSCPNFQKNYVCHHILGLAVRQKLYEVRPEAKSIPIGEKRKRGRPKLAKKALLRQ